MDPVSQTIRVVLSIHHSLSRTRSLFSLAHNSHDYRYRTGTEAAGITNRLLSVLSTGTLTLPVVSLIRKRATSTRLLFFFCNEQTTKEDDE